MIIILFSIKYFLLINLNIKLIFNYLITFLFLINKFLMIFFLLIILIIIILIPYFRFVYSLINHIFIIIIIKFLNFSLFIFINFRKKSLFF